MQKAAEEAALDKQAEKEAAVQKGAKEALITQLPKLVQPLFEHKSLKALKDVHDLLSQGHVFSVIHESLECEGKLCCQDSTFVMLTGCLQHACALHLYENPR